MSTIAVDIDDTLYDFGAVAKDALFHIAHEREDKGVFNAAYADARQWRGPNDIAGPETWMEAINRAHQPEVIAAQTPYAGAAQTVRALRDKGHQILYISNRNDKAAMATEEWLADHDFPIAGGTDLICTMADKIRLMSGCQYLIDDRPKTLVQFVYDFTWKYSNGSENKEKARKAFGLQKSYNENMTDIPGVYLAPSWAGLNYYLVEKGLLSKPAFEPLS